MTEKQFFDYETEGGTGLMFPRNHLRNMLKAQATIGFPFNLVEKNGLYTHPYDIYSDPKTNSRIWVIGGDAHCHTKEKLARYKEGIVLYCKPEHKEDLIKRISKEV
ncbi:hypothetical protein K8R30_04335 [archaeon]|nr:hypothetical protein [archaeon]